MRVKELFTFMQERHNIYLRRQRGEPKPWTQDTILQRYRFTNAYRELDPVTVWIRKNWREPHAKDHNLWFALVVARMFNLPSTLELIEYPVPFRPEHVRKAVNKAQKQGNKVFNSAYMIRCDCQEAGKTKVDYLIEKVFKPMWGYQLRSNTLSGVHEELMKFYGMGSFMSAQVIADLKYAQLKDAPDWWTFAAPGPGSERGLAWVYDCYTRWQAGEWQDKFQALYKEILPLVKKAKMPPLHAQDLQSWLCEYDKWCRVKYDEGRPKQLYPGTK